MQAGARQNLEKQIKDRIGTASNDARNQRNGPEVRQQGLKDALELARHRDQTRDDLGGGAAQAPEMSAHLAVTNELARLDRGQMRQFLDAATSPSPED